MAEGAWSQRADLLVGLSNDGWYPNSSLIEHHFWEAMCRSLETGLPMVRSANCGLATAVSAKGEVLFNQRSPPAGQLVIYEVDLPLATRATPYRYLGLWGVLGIALLGVLLAVSLSRENFQIAFDLLTKPFWKVLKPRLLNFK